MGQAKSSGPWRRSILPMSWWMSVRCGLRGVYAGTRSGAHLSAVQTADIRGLAPSSPGSVGRPPISRNFWPRRAPRSATAPASSAHFVFVVSHSSAPREARSSSTPSPRAIWISTCGASWRWSKGQADRVNLIVNLAALRREVLVPRSSLSLNAGPDDLGRDQIYATDRDLVVNRAQDRSAPICLCGSWRRIGFKARARSCSEVGLRCCRWPWGSGPGDPLPPYGEGYVDKALLSWFDTLIGYLPACQTATSEPAGRLSLAGRAPARSLHAPQRIDLGS